MMGAQAALLLSIVLMNAATSLVVIEPATSNATAIQIPAYVANYELGAPLGDYAVSGWIRLYHDNPCNPNAINGIGDMSGAIVVITHEIVCAHFVVYDVFAAR